MDPKLYTRLVWVVIDLTQEGQTCNCFYFIYEDTHEQASKSFQHRCKFGMLKMVVWCQNPQGWAFPRRCCRFSSITVLFQKQYVVQLFFANHSRRKIRAHTLFGLID